MIVNRNSREKPVLMSLKINLSSIVALALTACLLAPAAYADLNANVEQCDGCHGVAGVSTESDVPTIAGISTFVLEEYMFQYADNARSCRESKFRYGDTSLPATDMCVVAAGLSEDEITEVAEYYAAKDFVAAAQPFDAALAAEGAKIHKRDCERCHTDGGSYADDDAGRLAGQWLPYLEEAFADYASGARPIMEKKMQQKIEMLDAKSIAALVNYYASLR